MTSKLETERVYSAQLDIMPDRIFIGNKAPFGVLVIVQDDFTEDFYNHLENNITSLTHMGITEAGATGIDGIRIKRSFNSLEALNIGAADVVSFAEGIVVDGIKNDSLLRPDPRTDLSASLHNLLLISSKQVRKLSNLSSFKKWYDIDAVEAKGISYYADLISKAHLVPDGHTAEWR
ncbi:hypothetical protein GPK34_00915 [Secundilactobacillus kimchicus]|uniref:hypothetical protein n=1 Tax=Secundilactobacillus kimchicus TaxID=528209 RepID=UPI001C037E05|nr:hypothetical protein [Secundilactobacillus kimchicus]MBT9670600.1 hypothetical protein [Secundilactobacillus kimchicus]